MGAVIAVRGEAGPDDRGMYGNGAEAQGQLYQMSNVATLGRSEEDVIRSLVAATGRNCKSRARHARKREKRICFNCRCADALLGRDDACAPDDHKGIMAAVFGHPLCRQSGYLHLPIPALDVLMMDLQPGSLGVRAGHLIGEREAEILRAKILREELSALSGEET